MPKSMTDKPMLRDNLIAKVRQTVESWDIPDFDFKHTMADEIVGSVLIELDQDRQRKAEEVGKLKKGLSLKIKYNSDEKAETMYGLIFNQALDAAVQVILKEDNE